jgi:predicted lipoprotein
MRQLFCLFTAVVLGATPLSAQEAAPPAPVISEDGARMVMARVVDDVILPGYRDFADASGKLQSAMGALCTAPSPANVAGAKAAFAAAAESWSHIEILRVGPVIEGNRFERILFYPDRKSTGLKQVQALLSKPDESATSPAGLASKSVAIQGLGALEYILYGTGAETLATAKNSFRCRYGLAIAGNVQGLASELVSLWDQPDGIQRAWKSPGPESTAYRNGHEALTEVLGVLVHGTETLRDQRLETFYKGGDRQVFPRQALFWRSGLTWMMFKGNLAGLRQFVHQSGVKDLLRPGQAWIVNSIDVYLTSLAATAGEITPDLEKAVATPEQRNKLDALLSDSRDLVLLFNDDLGSGLGLTAGFSFSDGD